jgi:acyl-CoA synthetase (AMP-forming)/AMP-acid ligase II
VKPSVRSQPPSPVPPDILEDATTLSGALASIAVRFPSFECLTMLGSDGRETRVTVGELWAQAQQLQSGLVARGLRPGDVALVALPTGIELAATYFGIMLAGGIPSLVATPSNRFADRRTYHQRLQLLTDVARAGFIVGDDEIVSTLREHGGCRDATIVTVRQARAPSGVAPVAASPDDVATLQFSSGATAHPKGVVLTHRAVLNNFRAIRRGLAIDNDDVSVSWAPLYHDMGLFDGFVLPLLSGCQTVLVATMDFIRQPVVWLRAMHRYRGTLSWAPNFAYALCVQRIAERDLAGLDLSRWRVAASGAEPVLADTIEEFATRFVPYGYRREALTPIYGMAENVTIATAHALDEPPHVETLDRAALAIDEARPVTGSGTSCVSVGRPLPGCNVEVRDDEGRPLPDRRVGTIWLHSNSLCAGYHRDPVGTAAVFADGWLNTGDRGYIAAGELYFVSREKDLIVIAGEKYAPHDIEAVISTVPGVRAGCAVAFGVSNAERGTEDLVAVIETKVESDDERAALRDAIRIEVTRRTGLALQHALLVPPGGIDKTSSGKLARAATQRRYANRFV